MSGSLVLVATPIGNLRDLSPRAVEVLTGADLICCEDTRRTGKLLELAGVSPRPALLRVDDHTEAALTADITRRIEAGQTVAVVSDAGTPGISDPGERLVRAAVEAGLEVTALPGPSAAVTALVVSGLPTARFAFEGFLARKGSARSHAIREVAAERRTVVLYEAPHRLQRTLADLAEACGADRRVAVARELTKLHEQVWRGTLADAVDWAGEAAPRGEVVIVVEGAPDPVAASDHELDVALQAELLTGSSVRDASDIVAARLSVPRRRAYQRALEVSRHGGR